MKALEKDREKIIKQIRTGLIKELKSYEIKKRKINGVSINDSRRIKIPKEYEDEVLFNYYFDEEGQKYKRFAITSGLYKIDLSEVDITDLNLQQDNKSYLDLSYTNLNMDFTKLYNDWHERSIKVSNVDFSYMDLYKSKLTMLNKAIRFENCDFISANLRLPYQAERVQSINFINCSLTGNDLSSFIDMRIDINGIQSEDRKLIFTEKCNLSNTGLKIKYPHEIYCDPEKEYVRDLLKTGYLNGCYIDGKKVMSKEEWLHARTKALENYKKFLNDEAQNVLNDIHAQIVSPGRNLTSKSEDPVLEDIEAEDAKLGIDSSYDQDKIDKACEEAGKIKSNQKRMKSSGLVLTPEQDHDV